MSNKFLIASKEIADRFLQNIIFVDDMAYMGESDSPQAFDSMEVTKVFASAGKLCTIIAPNNSDEFIGYQSLLMKADVVVLDWTLIFKKQENNDLDPEADAPDEDVHGSESVKIIRALCKECQRYKLIIVYTGDVNLEEVNDSIFNSISDLDGVSKGACEIRLFNTTICVRAKDNQVHGRFTYLPNFKQYVLSYNQLPSFILDKFTQEVCGIVPDFVLNILATIRENTSLILSKLSKDLDSAYIGHRILQENQDDAKFMLNRLLGDALIDLINTKKWDYSNLIQAWVEECVQEPMLEEGKTFPKEILLKLIDSSITIDERKNLVGNAGFKGKNLEKYAPILYPVSGTDLNFANIEFAKLTHHKNYFKPSLTPPVLSLGTVVMSLSTKEYYVCVQQRCDSVRISEGVRNFIFLPLKEKGGKHPILTDEGKALMVDYTSYNIKVFPFKATDGCVVARRNANEEYIFVSNKIFEDDEDISEEYRWIVDLKDLHAQRIINAYCAQVYRVGLDESEWLRTIK